MQIVELCSLQWKIKSAKLKGKYKGAKVLSYTVTFSTETVGSVRGIPSHKHKLEIKIKPIGTL
jgi:hypothetical protein